MRAANLPVRGADAAGSNAIVYGMPGRQEQSAIRAGFPLGAAGVRDGSPWA